MSYTNPLGHPQGVSHKVTNLLRQVMIAELVAINEYQTHILHSDIAAVNEAWYHIMLDEKSHYIIALNLLRKYDPVEYKYFLLPHEIKANPDSAQASQTSQNIHNTQNTQNAQNIHNVQKHKSTSTAQPNRTPCELKVILNYIREDIKGELEAIILYEDEIAEIQQKDVRIALQKIIDDEKEHTEHLTQVLLVYDPDPYKP